MYCSFCGKEEIGLELHRCKYCGLLVCNNCILPENHGCRELPLRGLKQPFELKHQKYRVPKRWYYHKKRYYNYHIKAIFSLLVLTLIIVRVHAVYTAYNNLKLPKYSEVVNFMIRDNTDKHPYIIGSYVCEDFARDFRDNAIAAGYYKSGIVTIYLSENERGFGNLHALVCITTSDKGIVYVEPQCDTIVSLKLYQKYNWGDPSGTVWVPTSGVITKIEISWYWNWITQTLEINKWWWES